MDELDTRLATIARTANDAARLPDAAVVRRKGHALAIRRRVTRGAGVALLLIVLAGGYAVREGTWSGPEAGPVTPASDPSVPGVVQGGDVVADLRGPARDGTWMYRVVVKDGKVCDFAGVVPDGGNVEGCTPGVNLRALNTATVSCGGGGSPGGEYRFNTLITGAADQRAAVVKLDLLDGRRLSLEPVPSERLGVTFFGTWVPECVSYANVVVEDGDGRVIAGTPLEPGKPAGRNPATVGLAKDPRGELRLAAGTTADRRTDFLRAIELLGATLYHVDGDTYRFVVQGSGRGEVAEHLDQAEAEGTVERYQLGTGSG